MKIAVTGAYGFSGKYAARLFSNEGHEIVALTSKRRPPDAPPGVIETYPLDFGDSTGLTAAMLGCDTLVNTYWIRYEHKGSTHLKAVENSKILIESAVRAKIKRIVHVSILNPSADSPSPYYRGKAEVEAAIKASGLSYAVLRPAVLFGDEDILINNIAYFLRRYPALVYPGDGSYGIRPIFVEDFAALIYAAVQSTESYVLDAVGRENFTFRELVLLIRSVTGSRAIVKGAENRLAFRLTKMLSAITGDLVLSWDEIVQLTSGVLSCDSPATGETKLSEWLAENKDKVGVNYHSETARHFQ